MLSGKTVVLGVTSSIAAYKACDTVSALKKLGADVFVCMSRNATELITPLTFETLSNNKVIINSFDKEREFEIQHIGLQKRADILVIAPATANVIAKIAAGVADDFLTTAAVALCKKQRLICPAMNTAMYEDGCVQQNLQTLAQRGWQVLEPATGRLACGDEGVGKLADPADITAKIISMLIPVQDFAGKNVLITAGATRESIDGVRYLSNESSGKMGIALAEAAAERGAKVTLIHGFITRQIPPFITNKTGVATTNEMYSAVMQNLPAADCVIMAAAPADYTPEKPRPHKIKSKTLNLKLVKTQDIAAAVGKVRGGKKLVIFAAETQNGLENAKLKLSAKGADMVVLNDVTQRGAGFNTDTNIITTVTKDGAIKAYPMMSKALCAHAILDDCTSSN